ncbi:MAG TPA: hypothetical protein VFU29_06170 [Chitinophagaceae bacterium]|nr:hypothetical protein [Chitinophagaceae bacterium]
MKKIRNIKDLENEKLKLRVKQLELERQMERSWKGLRNNFSKNKVAEQKQTATSFNFKTGNALLNGALNYGAIFLSHRVGLLAGRTIENAAEKILGKLSQKINSLVSKRKRSQKS